jgi:hypothetical protein
MARASKHLHLAGGARLHPDGSVGLAGVAEEWAEDEVRHDYTDPTVTRNFFELDDSLSPRLTRI